MTGYVANPMVFSVAGIGLSHLTQTQKEKTIMISNTIVARFTAKASGFWQKRLDLRQYLVEYPAFSIQIAW